MYDALDAAETAQQAESGRARRLAVTSTVMAPVRHDYSGLGEMAAILTNGDPSAVAMARGLSLDPEVFRGRHSTWADKHLTGVTDAHQFRIIAFAHWVMGKGRRRKYGAFIPAEHTLAHILPKLEYTVKDLQFPVDLQNVDAPRDLPAAEALQALHDHLTGQGAHLVALRTDGTCGTDCQKTDGYHVFIVPDVDMCRLMQVADAAGFQFTEHFA